MAWSCPQLRIGVITWVSVFCHPSGLVSFGFIFYFNGLRISILIRFTHDLNRGVTCCLAPLVSFLSLIYMSLWFTLAFNISELSFYLCCFLSHETLVNPCLSFLFACYSSKLILLPFFPTRSITLLNFFSKLSIFSKLRH